MAEQRASGSNPPGSTQSLHRLAVPLRSSRHSRALGNRYMLHFHFGPNPRPVVLQQLRFKLFHLGLHKAQDENGEVRSSTTIDFSCDTSKAGLPLFHQLEARVKAHVMVAFLGYALWFTLKHLLRRRAAIVPRPTASGVENAQPFSPMRALSLLSTLQSADIVLPTTDGREIRLSRITEPAADQRSLLQQLGLVLPDRFHRNRECSVDSATA